MLSVFIGLSALAQSALFQAEPGAAGASIAAPPPASPPAAASAAVIRLPAGTQIEVELLQPLSSATSKLGDRFAIRLAAPIVSGGVELAPAGATGEGEVIDAGRAGINGKEGKLIVSARRLDLNGRQVRLRGMSLMAAGRSRVDIAVAAAFVAAPVSLFIKGGEIEMPAGLRAAARLAEDVEFKVDASAKPEGKAP